MRPIQILLALVILVCAACGASDVTGPTALHRLHCDEALRGRSAPGDCAEE